MRRRTVALALAAVAAVASGCGERAEPLGEIAPKYPVTVAGAGDEAAVVGASPRRIVALERGPAQFVIALGAEDRLVGVPFGVSSEGAKVVGTPAGRVGVAAVARLRPDILLATPATDPVDLGRAERASGAGVYVQPADSVEEIERGAIELGFILGEPVAARRLAGSIRREIAEVEERVARTRPLRVFIDTGFLITVPERSLVGDLVRRAGGESVAGPTPRSEPFTPCQVARLEPDVILVVAHAASRPFAPRYACRGEVPGRLARVPEDVVTIAGPRVATSLALVARALHPDAFG